MSSESNEFQLQVALFSEQTRRLEEAHANLRQQFEALSAKLDASHQTLQQIVSHMSDGLLFVTSEGKITLYNPAAARITGLAQEAVLNSSFWEHFADDLFGFPIGLALKKRHTPGRIVLSLSNGREIEVAPAVVPEKGILLLLNDRTELKQLEKSVQQSDRLKELGEMAATLAHEIRNPLGGIEGFASLLERDLQQPDQKRMVAAILEGSRTLNTLVTQVLDYARPLTLHFTPTKLAPFLEETAALARASGFPCSVCIKKTHTRSIDAKRMQLVLLNLIRNSHEAGSSEVELVLTETGEIQVIDNGEGIAPDQLETIFTPFFTTKTTGTGLGLSEASKVVRAHDGSITIDSKVGKGTCITIDYGNQADFSSR